MQEFTNEKLKLLTGDQVLFENQGKNGTDDQLSYAFFFRKMRRIVGHVPFFAFYEQYISLLISVSHFFY